jgi:hypothetical protein
MKKDVRRISEHVQRLSDLGAVEPVGEESGEEGGVVHYYRASRYTATAADWAALSSHEKSQSTINIVRMLHEEMLRSLAAGSFASDPDHCLIRRPVWLDREGLREYDALLRETDDRAVEIERRAAERRESGEHAPIRAVLGLSSFPVAPGDPLLDTP